MSAGFSCSEEKFGGFGSVQFNVAKEFVGGFAFWHPLYLLLYLQVVPEVCQVGNLMYCQLLQLGRGRWWPRGPSAVRLRHVVHAQQFEVACQKDVGPALRWRPVESVSPRGRSKFD